MKGLTSIELAILLAIIIVIAVAVGWYMYTTFLASTSSSPKLQIVSATFNVTKGALNITVINPGPVNNVGIAAVYLNGISCTVQTVNGTQPSGTPTVPISKRPIPIGTSCSGINAAAGTQLSGQLVTTAGTAFPFVATVVS
jgi:uncharacterized protein (UPF0333 family)